MRALVRALLPALALTTVMTTGTAAQAAPTPAVTVTSSSSVAAATADSGSRDLAQRTTARTASRGERVVRVARSKRGAPYRYGAAGPRAFDCSGFTQWVFRHVDERLPHSSDAQVGRTRRIRPGAARPGDLVFFHDGGNVYHVGIYAGRHSVWHSPRTGSTVHKARIWTRSVFYGRVR